MVIPSLEVFVAVRSEVLSRRQDLQHRASASISALITNWSLRNNANDPLTGHPIFTFGPAGERAEQFNGQPTTLQDHFRVDSFNGFSLTVSLPLDRAAINVRIQMPDGKTLHDRDYSNVIPVPRGPKQGTLDLVYQIANEGQRRDELTELLDTLAGHTYDAATAGLNPAAYL